MKTWLIVLFLLVYGCLCCQPVPKKRAPVSSDTAYAYRTPSADGTGKYYLGREIAPVMDAAGADWLERPERQTEENAELAIAKMQLPAGSVVADIGAGTGYYTFKIASRLPTGKVFAVELQEALINYLHNKKALTGSQNVEVTRGDTFEVNLPDSSVDLAIMVDVYHELAWPREVIRSISRSLKPDGKILLIEYRGEDPSIPIKPLHKTTVSQLTREMKDNGFILDLKGDFLPIQHFFVVQEKAVSKSTIQNVYIYRAL